MTRRALADAAALLLLLLWVVAAIDPAAGQAPTGKPARIGRLPPLTAQSDEPNLAAFRKGLQELGWVEPRDFVIETRFADGDPARLPGLAAELVRRPVDLLVVGSTPGTLPSRRRLARFRS